MTYQSKNLASGCRDYFILRIAVFEPGTPLATALVDSGNMKA